MRDINSITLTGRATRDAELKYTKSGMPVLGFSLASNYSVKNSDGTWGEAANFIDCSYFGKGAEAVSRYIGKGTAVVLEGELRQERWDQDGQPRSRLKVIVRELRIMDFHKDKQQETPGQADPQPAKFQYGKAAQFPEAAPVIPAAAPAQDPLFFDDDIPF